ncbi:predicted protein [Plenodomus lingam JN3]|uniref:Predicted protein n=1 Tax=Leptosphaeria maculans (strain JN3 / isolate v23.1.3 / race Av1-4-5-6-7-8) TaxID=985895 RepID=E5A840_LEPMJ|nr:predicted protein [Plenodomus lingam JN3]CBX99785.1 predicted protein [Plenodomus lingam JN3]
MHSLLPSHTNKRAHTTNDKKTKESNDGPGRPPCGPLHDCDDDYRSRFECDFSLEPVPRSDLNLEPCSIWGEGELQDTGRSIDRLTK